MGAVYLASLVVFFVLNRYRYPLAPFVILFAAAGLAELRRFFKESTVNRKMIACAVAGAVAIFSNWPFFSKAGMRPIMFLNLSQTCMDARNFDDAIRYAREALA